MPMVQPAHAYDEVASFFANGPSRQEISTFRLSDAAVARLRYLLLKKSAATLTEEEADELDECVHLDRVLLLIRSRALEQLVAPGA
jgi:hypothetical protein